MGIIYKIISPNNKIYVGQTYNLNQRMDDYKCIRHRSKKSIIIASIMKYGWKNHIMSVLEEVDDSKLDEREMFWIKELNTLYPDNKDGMNLTKGGLGCRQSWKHDKDRVAKARLRCGVNAPGYGKKLSVEAKMKISAAVSKYNKENNKKPLPQCYKTAQRNNKNPVICYDVDGNFLSEYDSIKDASKILGIDRKTANDALLGKQFHGGGYIFKRRTENYPAKIEVDKSKIVIRRRPILCFFDGEPIAEFPTLKLVAKNLNIKLGTIEAAFYDNRITRDGFYFIYKDLYEEILKAAS